MDISTLLQNNTFEEVNRILSIKKAQEDEAMLEKRKVEIAEYKNLEKQIKLQKAINRQITQGRRARNVDPIKMNEKMETLKDLDTSMARRINFLQAHFLNGTLPPLAYQRQINQDHEFRTRRYDYGH